MGPVRKRLPAIPPAARPRRGADRERDRPQGCRALRWVGGGETVRGARGIDLAARPLLADDPAGSAGRSALLLLRVARGGRPPPPAPPPRRGGAAGSGEV